MLTRTPQWKLKKSSQRARASWLMLLCAPFQTAISSSFCLLLDRVGHEVGFEHHLIRWDALDSQLLQQSGRDRTRSDF